MKNEENLREHIKNTKLASYGVEESIVLAFKDLWAGRASIDSDFARRCYLCHEIFVEKYFPQFI